MIRSEPYGAIVHIFCKTTGDTVHHNNRWYLLTDGTWAWGAAHYIKAIGPSPAGADVSRGHGDINGHWGLSLATFRA